MKSKIKIPASPPLEHSIYGKLQSLRQSINQYETYATSIDHANIFKLTISSASFGSHPALLSSYPLEFLTPRKWRRKPSTRISVDLRAGTKISLRKTYQTAVGCRFAFPNDDARPHRCPKGSWWRRAPSRFSLGRRSGRTCPPRPSGSAAPISRGEMSRAPILSRASTRVSQPDKKNQRLERKFSNKLISSVV